MVKNTLVQEYVSRNVFEKNMKNKKTFAINFYGGPGTGKSTMAAAVFAKLKSQHINCELVTEYAKKKVWEEAFKVFECQMYVCAKQVYAMFVVSKQVEAAITDSPIILGTAYTNGDKLLNSILFREYKKYNNVDIFLNRVKKYNPKGRMQTEEEAKDKDKVIKAVLNKYKIKYHTFDGSEESVDKIVSLIKSKMEK